MSVKMKSWVTGANEPRSFYELLGRPLFDPDHKSLLAAIQSANRELLQYQNHADPNIVKRAQRLMEELGRARAALGSPDKLRDYQAQVARTVHPLFAQKHGAAAARWNVQELRRWLKEEQKVHSERLDQFGEVLIGLRPQAEAAAVIVPEATGSRGGVFAWVAAACLGFVLLAAAGVGAVYLVGWHRPGPIEGTANVEPFAENPGSKATPAEPEPEPEPKAEPKPEPKPEVKPEPKPEPKPDPRPEPPPPPVKPEPTRPSQTESPYYPLKVGTEWEYLTGGAKSVMRVSKHELVGDVTCALVESVKDGQVVGKEHIAVGADGIYRHSVGGQRLEPPLRFLKLPARAGDSWEVEVRLSGQLVKGTYRTGEGAVQVPAGKYQAVSSEMRLDGTNLIITSWFAPGVGIVKQVVRVGETDIVMELVRHGTTTVATAPTPRPSDPFEKPKTTNPVPPKSTTKPKTPSPFDPVPTAEEKEAARLLASARLTAKSNRVQARQILLTIIKKYPDTVAALDAEQMLMDLAAGRPLDNPGSPEEKDASRLLDLATEQARTDRVKARQTLLTILSKYPNTLAAEEARQLYADLFKAK